MLLDTPANRKKLEKVLYKVEAEIIAGTFVYVNYFPNSKALKRLAVAEAQAVCEVTAMKLVKADIDSAIKEAAPETPPIQGLRQPMGRRAQHRMAAQPHPILAVDVEQPFNPSLRKQGGRLHNQSRHSCLPRHTRQS